jgi:hypothetical protein
MNGSICTKAPARIVDDANGRTLLGSFFLASW